MIDIQEAGITSRLVSAFGLKGRFRPRLDEVVVPVALVADLQAGPVGQRLYQDIVAIPAVAGEVPAVIIAAPAPAQGGGIVEPIFIRARSIGTLANLDIRVDAATALLVLTAPADLVGTSLIDPVVAPPSPLIGAAGTLAAAGGTPIDNVRLAADVDVFYDLRGMQLTGRAASVGGVSRLLIFGSVANVALNFAIRYRYRPDGG